MGMPSLKKQHHVHDEGWIVSYADMMTLLFGFFVILYSFANMDDKKLEEFGKQVAENLNGKNVQHAVKVVEEDTDTQRQLRAFRLLLSVMSPGADLDKEIKRVEQMTAAIAADAGAQKIVMEGLKDEIGRAIAVASDGIAADSVVEISLPGTTLFQMGSDELLPAAQPRIRELAATLAGLNGLTTIEVVGHTDSSLPGKGSKFQTNWAMSSARAGSVAAALAENGVDLQHMLIRGMADLDPLVPERSSQGVLLPGNQAKNRRVSIVIRKTNTRGR